MKILLKKGKQEVLFSPKAAEYMAANGWKKVSAPKPEVRIETKQDKKPVEAK